MRQLPQQSILRAGAAWVINACRLHPTAPRQTFSKGVEHTPQPFCKGRGSSGLLKNKNVYYPIGRCFLTNVKKGAARVPRELQYCLCGVTCMCMFSGAKLPTT